MQGDLDKDTLIIEDFDLPCPIPNKSSGQNEMRIQKSKQYNQ